ncbi:MAG: hypothetical protein UR53_C0007G0006 [Candidatus Magasanikbacteria bacterium GW2011_GWC2_34_16]|uniref:Uncharacterized protein n=1 Tax=Candidatus Magasanikbacteria bacterium GW2011_GWC2_34_16 TaxID=1619045 RepID=A0A0G0AQ91_9BACT|nr:MAG: hypothetical protein UR53_C0007G0006 [Candidatus Magasanikbacteria bacterium GW2011_GWC2_34_16]
MEYLNNRVAGQKVSSSSPAFPGWTPTMGGSPPLPVDRSLPHRLLHHGKREAEDKSGLVPVLGHTTHPDLPGQIGRSHTHAPPEIANHHGLTRRERRPFSGYSIGPNPHSAPPLGG